MAPDNTAKASDGPKCPSKNEIYQSYGGWNNFMMSYGFKGYEPDDVKEGNAIVETLREGENERRVDAAEGQVQDQESGGQGKDKKY
ncbi:hypothetical protein LTR37_020533 [Vermiconidia calcicola]|uniref:Uncharacterized protein n=1 Tax=Vermiconidia calcicola TaxID=1690605 RepID=A0ACC3MC62_9PEZI|nr:hypothetical protein LTR37_020533 [Vermiconidia calcicola]